MCPLKYDLKNRVLLFLLFFLSALRGNIIHAQDVRSKRFIIYYKVKTYNYSSWMAVDLVTLWITLLFYEDMLNLKNS